MTAHRRVALSPRLVMATATGGLVALASAGTALLVLTGTSVVAPPTLQVPPLPAERPQASRPGAGVVVVPPARAVEKVRAPRTTRQDGSATRATGFPRAVVLAAARVPAPEVPAAPAPVPPPVVEPVPVAVDPPAAAPELEPVEPAVEPVVEPTPHGALPALRRGGDGDEEPGDDTVRDGSDQDGAGVRTTAAQAARPEAGKHHAAAQAARSQAAPRAYLGGVDPGQSRAGTSRAPKAAKAGERRAEPAKRSTSKGSGKAHRAKRPARSS